MIYASLAVFGAKLTASYDKHTHCFYARMPGVGTAGVLACSAIGDVISAWTHAGRPPQSSFDDAGFRLAPLRDVLAEVFTPHDVSAELERVDRILREAGALEPGQGLGELDEYDEAVRWCSTCDGQKYVTDSMDKMVRCQDCGGGE